MKHYGRVRAKAVEVASRVGGDRSGRIRAIALLSKVKGEPAYQSIYRAEVAASPDKLRELRDMLKQTLENFLAGLDPAGADVEKVCLNMSRYPSRTPV